MPAPNLLSLEKPLVFGRKARKASCTGIGNSSVLLLLTGMLMGLGLAMLMVGVPQKQGGAVEMNAMAVSHGQQALQASVSIPALASQSGAPALSKGMSEKEEADALEAEKDEIVKNLAAQEQVCVLKHANEPNWKNSDDPTDKFPCMQAEATQFFANLEQREKAEQEQEEARLKAEKVELLAELEVQEKACLKKHENDKDFISKDPADKFPCMQAEASNFFTPLEKRSEEQEKAEKAEQEAEEAKLVKELEAREEACLKAHTNDKDFISKDPNDKFPCVQAEATNFFATLEKQQEEQEKVGSEAEAAQVVKDLEVQEQACLKKHAGDPNWKNSDDPTDKFPCMQAEATNFFSKLETEGEACVQNSEGKETCYQGPKKADTPSQEASKKAREDLLKKLEEEKPEGQGKAGLKAKTSKYGNPFNLPKSALRRSGESESKWGTAVPA
jgi:hypothetical protein